MWVILALLSSSAKSMIGATSDLLISSGPVAFHDCVKLTSAFTGSRDTVRSTFYTSVATAQAVSSTEDSGYDILTSVVVCPGL